MRGYLSALIIAIANLTCGSDVETSSQSSAVAEDEAQENEILPASAAGTPSESVPGIPEDFTGEISESISITQEELDSIRAAEALEAQRSPPGTKPTDLG